MADSRASISAFDALRVAAPAGASAARVARHRMPVGVAATAVAIIAVATSTQVLFQSIAIGAGAAGALADFLGALVDALMIGASIALAMTIALRAAPARGLAAGVAIAIVAGACAGSWMVEARYWSPADVTLAGVLPNAVRYALIAGVAVLIVERRRRATTAALAEIDQRIALERLALAENEARLALLRSQVEPHFLFNTLATIQRLQRTDPATGRDTLAGFIDYLCGALPLMGQRETTLGEEVDLAAAYLAVVRARMGDRLATSIDVPGELRSCAVPPFAVATLVENAVRHGLSPLREGGSLAIRARAADGRLVVAVEDTGVGVQGAGGSGTGLAHLQARLDVLHGERASVRIRANRPSGVVAEIAMPLRRTAGAAA